MCARMMQYRRQDPGRGVVEREAGPSAQDVVHYNCAQYCKLAANLLKKNVIATFFNQYFLQRI